MTSSSSRSALRLRYAGCAALAWGAFAAAWIWVAQRPDAALLSTQLLVVPASAAAVAVISAWWIRHNRRIYQRKGPRRGIPVLAGLPAHDRLGRPLHVDLDALAALQEVVLETTSLGKTYAACA